MAKKVVDAEQIIWSADVSVDELGRVLRAQALPAGTVIKLDRLFFEENEKATIPYCQELGYPVFVDAKIVEIPDKVIAIAETYLEYHPFMLNVMAGVCNTGHPESVDGNPKHVDALKRFAEACAKVGTKSCAVTVLTSKTEAMCNREFGRNPTAQVYEYASLMKDAGMTDLVCSPKEALHIRQDEWLNPLTINTPGVRLPKSDVRDQARVTTPAQALANGANRLVIGSNLTDGEGDLIERLERNYARIIENIEAGVEDATV